MSDIPEMRPANHADEIDSALRWRNEQAESVRTGKTAENAPTGLQTPGNGISESGQDLVLKRHRLELVARDAVEWLKEVRQSFPEGSYHHERLLHRIRQLERVIAANQ